MYSLILLFLLFSSLPRSHNMINKVSYSYQQQSLLAFRSSITHDPQNSLANWTPNIDLCNWTGIACDEAQERVLSINLKGMNLKGPVSSHIANISFMQSIDLSGNDLHGLIPPLFGSFYLLKRLSLRRNRLEGTIPSFLGNLSELRYLDLGVNKLSGHIPFEIGTLTNLRLLDLSTNHLSGTIPSLGRLQNLKWLFLQKNRLVGTISDDVGRLKYLRLLKMSHNMLSGRIPESIGKMHRLRRLFLHHNALRGPIPLQLGSLYRLRYLSLRRNRLEGTIPSSLGNLSALTHLDLGVNNLSGYIPCEIGILANLMLLDLSTNYLRGAIPSLGRLQNLERLFLQKNRLVGTIPDDVGLLKYLRILKISHNMLSGRIPEIGKMKRLKRLFLHHNHLSGIIPSSLGYCKHLQLLDLSHNSFIEGIPEEVANLSGIKFYLNLSHNYLEGVVPTAIGELVLAEAVDISRNLLTGVIPDTLGNCRALKYLNLSRNSIQGTIPYSLANLSNLAHLDLSFNSLLGEMPTALKKLASLRSLNLSYNSIAGDIDKGGSFASSTTAISLVGNIGLCGSIVPSLPTCGKKISHSTTLKIALGVVAATVAALMLLLRFLWKECLHKRIFSRSLQLRVVNPSWTRLKMLKNISYHDIVRATNAFSEANLLGRSNCASVYKGTLSDSQNVAVKVLDLTNEEANRSFNAECEVFRLIRHRNLAKIITVCYKANFKAMVFEYVCNGNLEAQLHPCRDGGCQLGLKERLDIAIDIAHAIEYLHHDCPVQVVHCDIKPSNVLLDEDMTAYVTDFGIARLLPTGNKTPLHSVNLTGSLGYIAPEYGLTSEVSAKGDVYSYGILLMEMFCGKRPTDEMFVGELNLHKWVKAAFLSANDAVIDESLTKFADDIPFVNALLLIGLVCSRHSPEARPTMKQVTAILDWIRKDLVNSRDLCELKSIDAWLTLAKSQNLYVIDLSRYSFATNSEGLGEVSTEVSAEDTCYTFAGFPSPGSAGSISPMEWTRKDLTNSEEHFRDGVDEVALRRVSWQVVRGQSRGAASAMAERFSAAVEDIWTPIAPVEGERESWLARAERLDTLLAEVQAANSEISISGKGFS